MSIGISPEGLCQQILAGRLSAGRLGVSCFRSFVMLRSLSECSITSSFFTTTCYYYYYYYYYYNCYYYNYNNNYYY